MIQSLFDHELYEPNEKTDDWVICVAMVSIAKTLRMSLED